LGTTLSKKWRFLIIFVCYLLLLYLSFLAIDTVVLPLFTAGASKSVVVPNVIGKDFGDAQKTLSNSNLIIKTVKEIYSEKSPAGVIISQVPTVNSLVKNGRYVFVTVSKGKEIVIVPYITGLSQRAAKINLMKFGLELGDVTYEFSDDVEKDIVISQSKKAGMRIPYGEYVNLVVSKGPEIIIKIPYLVGSTYSDAIQIIRESGLRIGRIDYKSDGTYLPDIIIMQSPQPGEIVTPETLINITITR